MEAGSTGTKLLVAWLRAQFSDDGEAVELRDESASAAEFLEVAMTALSVAAKRRFSGSDTDEVTRLVLDTKDESGMSDADFAPMIIEAAVRATLGEQRLLEGIYLGPAIPAIVTVVARIIAEDGLSEPEIDAFMSDVEQLLAK